VEKQTNRQTDKHTNAAEHPTHVDASAVVSAWVKMSAQLIFHNVWTEVRTRYKKAVFLFLVRKKTD